MVSVNNLRAISVSTAKRRARVFANSATTFQSEGITTRIATPKDAIMNVVRKQGEPDVPPFVFPFTPQQVQYSNLSPEISEISRPGKTPLIAFNRYKAKQVSFKFLIAVKNDGLFISVDESIDQLQRIVNSTRSVYFTNLDKQITNSLTTGNTNGIFWSIIDFSLSSIRRNADNKIVAAEANITLVENVNPTIKVADLPVITYTSAVPQSNKPGNKSKDVDFGGPTWSETEAGLAAIQ
ncbi:MAG: hypothetical protein ACO3I1_07805 [Burkholderiales bacterium]